MEDCIFCKMVIGNEPHHKIWEDEKHMAFLSIYPNTEGFTVVMPKKHYPSYAFENSDKVLSEFIIATKKIALLLDKSFDDVGRTGMFFEGFGVDHLHAKLFPMHGTANMEKWHPIDSDVKDMVFDKYPGYLSSNNGPRANDGDLAKLAEKIRKNK